MSLRYQIGIRILAMSLCILILGGSIAIRQARNAIREEVDSSITLALQLIRLSLPPASLAGASETEWLKRLGTLEQTRHLSIRLKQPTGQTIDLTRGKRAVSRNDRPPAWFVDLVSDQYPRAEHRVVTPDGKPLTLLIQADPLDEITEVWRETVAFVMTVCALIALSVLAVHLLLNKTLKAIDIIVANLRLIETGEYGQKLPEFATLEYDSIARAINHMTTVLDETRRQNRALTQHLLRIQEEERQRLSQELHDEFGQSLTALKVMALSAAHRRADKAKITGAMIDICDHLTTLVRSMMQQLHPLILTELGLKAALEDLVSRWNVANPELSFVLRCDDRVEDLEPAITIQLFRVIQECLTNTIRHAQATRVTIDVAIDREINRLMLRITDDGRGCRTANIACGFGLLGMQERIRSLDGELHVASRPGEGMRICVTVPLTIVRADRDRVDG
jgi:two-component system sensor histidine kinase UhpB